MAKQTRLGLILLLILGFGFAESSAQACKRTLKFATKELCQSNQKQVRKKADELNAIYATMQLAAAAPARLGFIDCYKPTFCYSNCGAIDLEIVDAKTNGQTHEPDSGCKLMDQWMTESKAGTQALPEEQEARALPRGNLPQPYLPKNVGPAQGADGAAGNSPAL